MRSQSVVLPVDAPGGNVGEGVNPAEGTHVYVHDEAGRIVSWTAPDGTGTVFEWDGSHNRVRAGDATFGFDARNRMVAGPAQSGGGDGGSTAGLYDWTARGTATLAGTDVMTHDGLGRRTFGSGLAVAYDSLDRPVRVTVDTGQLATITDGMLEAVEGEACSIPVLCEATGGLVDGPVGDLADELGAAAVAESFQPRDEFAQDLARLGGLLEWSSTNLLALDAADASLAESIVTYLEDRRRRGHLLYEDGE